MGKSDDSYSEEEPAPKLVHVAKNSLFVRNLSPQINEQMIREIFGKHDNIEKVTFRAFPNSNNQFFAQLDFASSLGVTEGTKLSGLNILGVPCEVGVIDPILHASQIRTAIASGADGLPAEEAQSLEEIQKRITEAKEDQRMRTVHVTGLEDGCTEEMFDRFCTRFGEVERLKLEKDLNGSTFGLVEFKDRPPAHIIKMQGQFLVDGRVIRCTESKSMVDESAFEESIVQFQAPIIDAMNMRQVLSQQLDLSGKLAQVRKAALELARKGEIASSEEEEEAEAEAVVKDTKKKKHKKEKKDKKEKTKEEKLEKKKLKKQKKKDKKLNKKEKQKQKKLKAKRKAQTKKKRKRKAGAAVEDDGASVAVSESPSGPVDLDSEVEVVDTLMVLGDSSASSVTSGSSSDDVIAEEPAPLMADAVDPVVPAAEEAPASPPPPPVVSLAGLVGKWKLGCDPKAIWTIEEGGGALFKGKAIRPKWNLAEDSDHESALLLFSEAQRAKGWELDMQESTLERLVWKKDTEADTIWERILEEIGPVQYGPALEFGPAREEVCPALEMGPSPQPAA